MRRTPGPSSNALTIAAALVAGLLLRLWFVTHMALVSGDSFIYGDIAKSWLDYGVYGFTRAVGPPHPTLIRLPGYPFFLAVCFVLFGREHYTAVMYAQIALDLATCALLAALAAHLFGRRAGIAALWLAALCPFTATYVAAPLAEVPTLICIAAAFYCFYRWQRAAQPSPGHSAGTPYNRWLYLLAASLSYGILLRPEQGLLAVAILPAMLWVALDPQAQPQPASMLRRAAPVIFTAALVLLPLVPWTIRNWRVFHVFQPLAPPSAADPGVAIPVGFQRWYRTWGIDFASTEDVYWNYIGSPLAIGDLPARAFDNDSQYAQTEALFNQYNQITLASPALDRGFAALAAQRIHDDPVRYYIALPVARLINMMLRPRTELFPIQLDWWRVRRHPGQSLFAVAYAALNLGYFLLGWIGFQRWRYSVGPPLRKTRNIAWAMAAFVILRSAVLLTLDNSEPRYTLEFFPVLIVCASLLFARQPQHSE